MGIEDLLCMNSGQWAAERMIIDSGDGPKEVVEFWGKPRIFQVGFESRL